MINVLIVDDDPMVAELNKYYLSQVGGFHCQATVATLSQARTLLADASVSIDLVLLDIYMQQENGLDLLPGLRELGEKTDVIIISSASDVNTVQKALHYGVVDYLIKPFQFSRFKEALSHYRQQSQILAQREFSQADATACCAPARRPREQEAAEGTDQHHPEHGVRVDRTAARQRILHRQPGQRHRHFTGILPQVPHLFGGERHSRHPYSVRRHRPPGLSVSAETGRDRHAERALPPGLNDAGR